MPLAPSPCRDYAYVYAPDSKQLFLYSGEFSQVELAEHAATLSRCAY